MTTIDDWRTDRVLDEVFAERRAQDAKWGEQNHPDGTGSRLRLLGGTDCNLDLRSGEELARIFRRRCDYKHMDHEGTFLDILLEEVFEAAAEEDKQRLRTELIQVAAVAVAWAEKVDRGN